jgi:hypothetical protein
MCYRAFVLQGEVFAPVRQGFDGNGRGLRKPVSIKDSSIRGYFKEVKAQVGRIIRLNNFPQSSIGRSVSERLMPEER